MTTTTCDRHRTRTRECAYIFPTSRQGGMCKCATLRCGVRENYLRPGGRDRCERLARPADGSRRRTAASSCGAMSFLSTADVAGSPRERHCAGHAPLRRYGSIPPRSTNCQYQQSARWRPLQCFGLILSPHCLPATKCGTEVEHPTVALHRALGPVGSMLEAVTISRRAMRILPRIQLHVAIHVLGTTAGG